MTRFENVEIILTKQDKFTPENYDQWQGSWQDVKNEEGVEFTASLLVTKYRYYDENGSYDIYRLEARIGNTDSRTKTLITVSSMDQLNNLTLVGESYYKAGLDGTVLTPYFHLGPKRPEEILP